MNKYFKKMCSFILTLMSVLPFTIGLAVHAADDSPETYNISKTAIILVMITLFIISSVAAAFITYRLRKNKLPSSETEKNTDPNDDRT